MVFISYLLHSFKQALTSDLVDALNELVKSLPRLPQQDALKPLFVAEAQVRIRDMTRHATARVCAYVCMCW
jgi:hypothetical protein